MPRAQKVITAPAYFPVTLAEAKAHIRVNTGNAENKPLTRLIAAATRHAERLSQRAIVLQTRRLALDAFPAGDDWSIRLDAPTLDVTAFTYTASDGTLTALTENTHFVVYTDCEPGRVLPAFAAAWPAAREVPQAVTVTYRAGAPITSIAATITAGERTVTPASMAGVIAGLAAEVNDGTSAETIVVSAVTSTTFTATFANTYLAGALVNFVPDDLRHAVLLITAHLYYRREESIAGALGNLPMGARDILLGNWSGNLE